MCYKYHALTRTVQIIMHQITCQKCQINYLKLVQRKVHMLLLYHPCSSIYLYYILYTHEYMIVTEFWLNNFLYISTLNIFHGGHISCYCNHLYIYASIECTRIIIIVIHHMKLVILNYKQIAYSLTVPLGSLHFHAYIHTYKRIICMSTFSMYMHIYKLHHAWLMMILMFEMYIFYTIEKYSMHRFFFRSSCRRLSV